MQRRLIIVVAVLALLGASCGDNSDDKKAASGGGAQKVTVNVDGTSDLVHMSSNKYYPSAVTLHPGDSIQFKEIQTGEPHTVTFGTMVEAGLAAADKAGPPSLANEPPELKAVPDLFPTGPGDAIQTTALPCFIKGALPADGAACAKVAQPAFDGTETYYNSGYLADKEEFTLKLASDIAPGTYRYMCSIHRSLMRGAVTVVPKAQKAQTAAEVSAAGRKSLADVVAKFTSVHDSLANLTAATAQAGGSVPDVPDVILDEFGPPELSIPVNGVVTWDVSGPHVVAFNEPEDAVGPVIKTPDGAVHLNQKAGAPAGGPGVAPGTPVVDKPTVINGGTWNGVGIRASGFLLGFGPPGILKFKLGFSKAGTYQYRCLIHPDMKATIKVG